MDNLYLHYTDGTIRCFKVDGKTHKQKLGYLISQNDDLSNVIFQQEDLTGINFEGKNLQNANLYNSDLSRANLSGANLRGADLSTAKFIEANLSNANLSCANLRFSVLAESNLKGVKFSSTNIFCSDLEDASNIPDIPFVCPIKGEFIGYKYINYTQERLGQRKFIVKLLIPGSAMRLSGTSNKCRCNRAKVLDIECLNGSFKGDTITNISYAPCKYQIGSFVYPDSYDYCRWNICSHGIHFFMTRLETLQYMNCTENESFII